jgi:hypothetical protein
MGASPDMTGFHGKKQLSGIPRGSKVALTHAPLHFSRIEMICEVRPCR